jgi:hypothetical protein
MVNFLAEWKVRNGGRSDENVCTSINSVHEVEYVLAEGSHLGFVTIVLENVHSIINL